jgi:TPR repeat protein
VHFGGGKDGFPKDPRKAATYFAKGCTLRLAPSCEELGALYYVGDGVARDAARAAQLLQDACDAHDEAACGRLGVLVEWGDGATADLGHARELYTTACNAGANAYACLHVDMLDAFTRGVPHDATQARAAWKRACDAIDGRECAYLGMLVDAGQGGARDADLESALMRKACRGTVALACEWLREHDQ